MTISPPLSELNREAYEVLFKGLGPSRAVRFLQQFPSTREDYAKIKKANFAGMSVKDIAAQIRSERKITD